ncbi:MAG: CPBP family intramembrane metalloprotease [Chloracidobacterium sp.]|nr:CPBP family intramembrane metalloprotease [Chloracidobacterium sp.]
MEILHRSSAGVRFAVFFVLACVFTWSLLPFAADSMPLALVALCGPAAAAFVVAFSSGRAALGDLAVRITDWRHSLKWYLAALLLSLPISAFRSLLEYIAIGTGSIEFLPISVLGLIVFVLVLGEEIGWRGFAMPLLLPRLGPVWSSVVLGTLWALWHLPLFYMPSMPQFGSPFAAFVIYTISLSAILTFLGVNTRFCVVIATLFHGSVNTFGFVNAAAGPGLRGWSNALSYGLAALLLGLIAWQIGRRPGENREVADDLSVGPAT